jgi:hypothetical protein
MSSAACLRSASRMLLILVALGVLGMHALAHMSTSAGAPAATSAQVVTFLAVTPGPADETSTGCGCGGTCLDPSDACLAIVNPRALPIPVPALSPAGQGAAGEDLATRDAPAAALPAAPPHCRIGLAVADLSVLRR